MNAGEGRDHGDGMGRAELLREILAARAEAVPISPDALGTIRARVGRDTRRRRGLAVGFSALATGAAAAVTAVVLSLGSAVPVVPASSTPGPTKPVPTTPVPTTPAPTTGPTTTTPPGLAALPIYLVGTVDGRDVLFREFHSAPGGDLPVRIRGALTDMIDGSPADPDYRTAWPAGAQVRGVRVQGDAIIVDLTVPAETPAQPALALQQLVHTATAVAASSGEPGLTSVRVLVDGASVARLWGVATSEPMVRESSAEILARVWLSSPQHGAVVGRTFHVQIVGTVYEATAVVRVRDAGGGVVRDETVTLDNGAPSRGEVRVSLTLAPGTYTLEAFYYSAKDGSVQGLDDHTIKVR
jgi:hypothetical protein